MAENKATETEAADATVEESGFKVFVGNLSFTTKESVLAESFGTYGNVTNVNIITRGDRSMGYGFVTFEKPEEAETAIKNMDKKTIDSREINVESATPRGAGGRGNFRGGFRGGPRGGRGGFRGNFRGAYQGGPQNSFRGGFRRGRGGRFSPSSPRRPTGEPSKTTLFVANLPFKMDDSGLKSVFAEYNPVVARVITHPNGMSKGFGFVEFSTEEDQQKALNEMNGFDCEGRLLAVKIALGEEPVAKQEGEEEDTTSHVKE